MGGGASAPHRQVSESNVGQSGKHSQHHDIVVTPRGVSAEDAVKRLRAMPNNFNHRMLCSIAKPKFVELDIEHKGLLRGQDLLDVAASALPKYKPGGMKATEEDDKRTLLDLKEALIVNEEALVSTF